MINGVKVVIKHNFDDTDQLCDPQRRREWIETTRTRILANFADGVNIDTEKPMSGATARCQTLLVRELRQELQQHSYTKHAQITFDVSWAPRGVDGRYYQWSELASIVDFFFVMSYDMRSQIYYQCIAGANSPLALYDMRSQIYYQCIAGANSPLALVRQGLEEFLYGFQVPAKKLVLGVPWYGYRYACTSMSGPYCSIRPVPFVGAPCSDAAGDQLDYADIQRLERALGSSASRHWDDMSQSPYLVYRNITSGTQTQIWFDDEASLGAKLALVRTLGLRGAGMWHADALDYTGDPDGARRMWHLLGAPQ
ncbi:hypothetical protein ATCC90586_002240 [Pythium insidiosum]|nr:hypothetical protein ATCC90586_002240 [Pythium insidiosum]